jgi:hypothetical protein
MVVIKAAPGSGPVTARIAGDAAGMSLVNIMAYELIHRRLSEEEIAELPPHMREDARNGKLDEILLEERGRADGSAPLQVAAGNEIHVNIRFSGPEAGTRPHAAATLVIEGPDWSTAVPLEMVVAEFTAELLTTSADVRQGGETSLRVRLASRAGPATEARFSLVDAGHLAVQPTALAMAPGESTEVDVRIQARHDASVTTSRETLLVTAFDGLFDKWLPFDLTVREGEMSVIALTTGAMTGIQGQRISAPIRILAAGGAPDVVFQPGSMPAGVSMPTQTRRAATHGAIDHLLDIELHPDAPLHVDAPVTVQWTAGSAASGTLTFLLSVLPREVTFHEVITTPAGTALGGWVEITLRADGSYVFRGHMHGSGFDPYEFRVVAIVRSGSGAGMVAAQKSGEVGGTVGGGSRDVDWVEEGVNPNIAADWANVSHGAMAVNKEYADTGILGTLGDIATAAVDWLVAALMTTPMTASIIILGRELGDLTGVHFGPPSLAAGIAVKEGVVLIFGPGTTLVASIAGAVGAASISERGMTPAERAFADRVFHGTIDYGNVVLTDISRGGRKFALPHVDGRTLIGLGDFFDDPMTRSSAHYPAAGQVFIHELVQAWQIEHRSFLTEVFWDAAQNATCELVGINPYALPSPLPAWSSLNLEQQASVVDQWYARHKATIDASGSTALAGELALADPAFAFISGNLWVGAG